MCWARLAQPLYHGRELAGGGDDVVVVTLNYRLGAFGFLDLSSFGDAFDTNNGLRDVLFALQWVRDNIERFGGDPRTGSRCSANPPAADIVTTLLAQPGGSRDCSTAPSPRAPRSPRSMTAPAAGAPPSEFLAELGLRGR